MAAGDAQRVWFPEMIARLRSQWRGEMSFEAAIDLRDELDAMLQQIRSNGHIRPPVFRCPRCRHVGPGAEPRVSVRAMLCSLLRFGIVEANHIKALERRWEIYRQQHRLDLYGKRADTPAGMTSCVHREVR